jgi:hypothetical protein
MQYCVELLLDPYRVPKLKISFFRALSLGLDKTFNRFLTIGCHKPHFDLYDKMIYFYI